MSNKKSTKATSFGQQLVLLLEALLLDALFVVEAARAVPFEMQDALILSQTHFFLQQSI